MSFTIDPAGLCAECKAAHKKMETELGGPLPVTEDELCEECKKKYGFIKTQAAEAAEEDSMKRKYTRKADKQSKPAKLDKDMKRLIKVIKRSDKKAGKLEAKADKYQARADECRAQAEQLVAGKEALREALE